MTAMEYEPVRQARKRRSRVSENLLGRTTTTREEKEGEERKKMAIFFPFSFPSKILRDFRRTRRSYLLSGPSCDRDSSSTRTKRRDLGKFTGTVRDRGNLGTRARTRRISIVFSRPHWERLIATPCC